ncbi:MAG TPA: sulfite reductase subunit alpha [Candidatus Didemnitutus sp.]|jgi:sulfite reductase (NADPH) flavoprotein alpha-component
MSTSPAPHAYSRNNPLVARVVENRVLNKEGSSKDVRHVVVDITGSGMAYHPGDSLGIFPQNRHQAVDELIARLGATGTEAVALPLSGGSVTLREALTSRLSLSAPTKKILETLAAKTPDLSEQSQLAALLAADAGETREKFLKEREFNDLLAEFPGATLTPQDLVDHLRRLMPRLYSIASSPALFPHQVHLTVAPVRYETNARKRHGVASTFLADRVTRHETPVPVFVAESHFRLPENPAIDVIMVGPGTGVAPFRAFVQHRAAHGATGRNWLFFGDQHQATDYLYGHEWEKLHAEGRLARIDLAFSRDQANKIYVQDRMRAAAAELWAWIKGGAFFYVCGDAHRMAKDVDATLHEIIATQGGMDHAAAVEFVKHLKKEKRYQRDVY